MAIHRSRRHAPLSLVERLVDVIIGVTAGAFVGLGLWLATIWVIARWH